MDNRRSQKPSLMGPKTVRRKGLTLSNEGVVKTDYLITGRPIPFVAEPLVDRINLAVWARENRDLLDQLLLDHRAVLFRGFDVKTVNDFKDFVHATSNEELLEYSDRSSPRYEVQDRIYVSTIYPADQRIKLHNEGTYWLTWPMKIYFCCLQTPDQGGETPIADVRKVFERIDIAIRERFILKGVMYVRNYNDGFGLSWQEVFQVTDRASGEAYCRKNAIDFDWKDGDRLRTRQVRPAVRNHPRTGEAIWFNHASFFHLASREPEVRRGLLGMFEEQDLPYMTYYGDGSIIDSAIIDHINDAYEMEKVVFPWRVGDILMLDNMSISHGREPYKGKREVVVAMAEPYQA